MRTMGTVNRSTNPAERATRVESRTAPATWRAVIRWTIHVITTAVSYREGILWASTYFGLSRYDGRLWRGYMDHDTGLASNFINFVKARGRVAWVCTDKGLSVVNGDTNRWVTYTPTHGPMEGDRGWDARVYHEGDLLETVQLENGLTNNFVLGVDFQGEDVWVTTSRGVSRGIGPEGR